MKLTWHLKRFSDLTLMEFWKIAYLRDQVFVVEQNSPYQEIDRQDLNSYHLYATDSKSQLMAYARFFKNGDDVSFGRVVVPKPERGKELGAALITETLKQIKQIYGKVQIVIEAQYYAVNFYKKFGFVTVGKPFIDAGRKHIKMVTNVR